MEEIEESETGRGARQALPISPAFLDFRYLLRLRLRSVVNGVRFATPRHRVIGGIFLAASVGFGAAIGVGFALFLTEAQRLDPAAARRLMERVVYFLFLFLFAGGLPFVSGALLSQTDLPLLSAMPVRPAAIVAARLVDAVWIASAQFLVIGIPLLVACGVALHYGPLSWLAFAMLLLLFLALPALLVALLLLVLTRLVGVRRVKSAVALTSALLALAVCLLTVKEFSHQASADDPGTTPTWAAIARSAQSVPPPPAWLPSSWESNVLISLGTWQWGRAAGALGLLLLLTGGTAALSIQLGGPVLVGESLLEGDAATGGSGRPDLLARMMAVLPLAPSVRALIAKDLRYVARDLTLLSQLGIPLILYFVPYVIGTQIESSSSSSSDIFLLSCGIVGTILYMETSILGLSGLGLEGRGFWLVLTAPIGSGTLVFAKWLFAMGTSAGVGALLYLSACLYGHVAPLWMLLGVGIILLTCAALCGIGVGIAGVFPRFVYENPAHRASVGALIWGFVAATGYVILAGVSLGGAWALAGAFPDQGRLFWILGAALFVVLSLGAAVIPPLIAAARLDAYPWED